MRLAFRIVVVTLLTVVLVGFASMLLFLIPGTPHHTNPAIIQSLSAEATDQKVEGFLQNSDRMDFWDTFIMPALVGVGMLLLSRLWLNLRPWEAGVVAIVMVVYRLMLTVSVVSAGLAGIVVFAISALPPRRNTATETAA